MGKLYTRTCEGEKNLLPPLDLTQQLDVKVFVSILKYINALVFGIDLDSGALQMIYMENLKVLFLL